MTERTEAWYDSVEGRRDNLASQRHGAWTFYRKATVRIISELAIGVDVGPEAVYGREDEETGNTGILITFKTQES